MTGLLLKLETFEESDPTGDVTLSPPQLEELKLGAFEQGYAAGWEDANAALDDQEKRLRTELAGNIQKLSFTFHEARNHLLRTLEPLIEEMAARVLPAMSKDTLAPIVLAQMMPYAEKLTDEPPTIVTHPDNLARIREMLSANTGQAIGFREDASMGELQATLQFAQTEVEIDLDSVIAAIRTAITNHFRHEQDEAQP